MEPKIRRLSHKYSMISAALSLVAHPLPAADEIIVIPIHYGLSLKMARVQGVRLLDLPWWQIHKIIWGGAALRFCFDVRSMVWPLLGYAFVTTWALLTIGIRRMMGAPEPSDTY